MDQPTMTFDGLNLTSITGIIAITFLLVEVLKRFFISNKGFGKIPVWVFAVIIAEGLALLANKVLHTANGAPLLSGDLQTILVRAFLAAASASGFFTWLNSSTSIANAQPMTTAPSPIVQTVSTETTTTKLPTLTPEQIEAAKTAGATTNVKA